MYEAYFNLKERPFSISPDPRFFYLTAQHKEALTNCQYMITNRVGPVYVHGDVGTGKTTIARRLYQQLLDDPHYIVAMIISGICLRRDSWNMTAVTQQCTACPSLAAAALEA